MGVTTIGLQQLDQAVQSELGGYAGIRMLELGNQYLYLDPPSKWPHLAVAKKLFEERGAKHTSVDINGLDGAIRCDLCRPLAEQGVVGPFDLVTDFGTAEHVPDLYQCLKNVHDACRVGGLMLHINPLKGNWPGHGYHYFTLESWSTLAKLAGYAVVYQGSHAAMHNTKDGWQSHVILRKVADVTFLSREQFQPVPIYPS